MKKTTEQFIAEARACHGDKYDYSRTNYVNSKTKVEIICPIHGSFLQIANDHIRKNGCLKCKVKSLDSFLVEVKQKHGDLYDYSLVEYKNQYTKVKIICPVHGEFSQVPYAHARGQGCPKCKFDMKRTGKEAFIERSKLVHGDKYDYSCVDYRNNGTKVCLLRPSHGEFFQIPKDHIRGIGCAKCKSSKGEKAIRDFLELKKINFTEQKEFEDCKYIRNLPFDFFVEDKKMLIEFQGEHHFPPKHKGRMYGATNPLDEYELIVKRDNIKREWCKNNGYKLVCISYKDIKKIDLILKKELGLDCV